MKDQILKLRHEGKTYNEIATILSCNKSLVSYYCNPNTKEVIRKSKENRKQGIYKSKIKVPKRCNYCNNEILNAGLKYCSTECSKEDRVRIKYLDYLQDQKSYNGYKTSMKWIKKQILKEQNNLCEICKINDNWNHKPLIFILDHIDGDACNNYRNNLRLVYHNCDSQLDTYKGRNVGKSTRLYKPAIY